ncbi:DUF169 domain-containing protein [Desulfoferrobacter suflitae]|uniref:DUF169 domain-containing protein n=1 Tax=Desulfoferrobacter suflitae TaxID=2865782 RepID=UPI00216408FE|nr:DUF169 domain-containing protein [Desulfoferrobacter suflitae]MCK8603547.1 DUF169 domain-containing protein [Desulfoferrobacter suflitae]
MSATNFKEAAEFIHNDLRLKTFPVAAKFLKSAADFPEKTRQPSKVLGKKVALCQAVTMARNYGWTVGLTREDVICVPAAVMFGLSDSENPPETLTRLFCEVNFSRDEEAAKRETQSMNWLQKGEFPALVVSPLQRASFEPDTVVVYGNAAQIMRLTQAWSYMTGERVSGHFGGKVECDEYLIGPFRKQAPCVVNPGNGERIFAGTQDDEMVFALPGKAVPGLIQGLQEVGKAMGVRYPVTPYLNFQPDFPKAHKALGKEVGIA